MVERINGRGVPQPSGGAAVRSDDAPAAAPAPAPSGGAVGDAGDAAAVAGGDRASQLGLGASSDAEFVRGLYRSILGREPESSGLEHHLKLLQGGMSRDQMQAAIMGSQERKNLEMRPAIGPRKPRGPADPGAPDPNPGKPGVVRDGPGGFLWKPVSDSTGKLAVLLPSQYAGDARRAWLVGPDGKTIEQGQDGGVGNGDRQHYRFSKPGGKYPPGTSVVVELANGEQATWKVQNTGARND